MFAVAFDLDYIGGTTGGLLPGLAWKAAHWPGCVAMICFVLVVAGATTFFDWKRRTSEPVPV